MFYTVIFLISRDFLEAGLIYLIYGIALRAPLNTYRQYSESINRLMKRILNSTFMKKQFKPKIPPKKGGFFLLDCVPVIESTSVQTLPEVFMIKIDGI